MFFTAAGSRFFVGEARPGWDARPVSPADFDGESWTEVGGVRSLGRIAGEWETVSWKMPDWGDPDAPLMTKHAKAVRPDLTMQVVAATMGDDPGQFAMLAAEAAVDAYPFRILLPTGAVRLFVALAVSAEQVVDEANSVLCWSFGLLLQSTLARG